MDKARNESMSMVAQRSWSRVAPRGLEQAQGTVRILAPYVAAARVARLVCIKEMRRCEVRRKGSDCKTVGVVVVCGNVT